MGAHAVLSLLASTPETEPKVVCLKANVIVTLSLMECIKNTLDVAEAIKQKDFDKALNLRGPYVYAYYCTINIYKNIVRKLYLRTIRVNIICSQVDTNVHKIATL